MQEKERQFFNEFDKLCFFEDKIDWDEINREFENTNWNMNLRKLHPEDMLSKFLAIS